MEVDFLTKNDSIPTISPQISVDLVVAILGDFPCSKDNKNKSFWRRSSQWTIRASIAKPILLLEYVLVSISLRNKEVIPLSKPNALLRTILQAIDISLSLYLYASVFSHSTFFLFFS